MPYYIDSIRVGIGEAELPITVRETTLDSADYHWLGYPEASYPCNEEPRVYEYSSRRDIAPWQTPLGYYTRPGDVAGLLREVDDCPLIMRHGYCAQMSFASVARQSRMSRTYFLYVWGVGKDMDMNGAFANTVEPLPYAGMTAYEPSADLAFPWTADKARMWLEYQTLDCSGPGAAPSPVLGPRAGPTRR